MLGCGNHIPTGVGGDPRRRGCGIGTAMGIALAVSLFAASDARAATCVSNFFVGTPNPVIAAGSSPATVASTIGSAITAASTAFLLQSTAFIASPSNPEPNQEGGGVWVRGVGGEVSVKSTTNAFGVASPVPGLPNGATGTTSCSEKVDDTFAGVQFGKDFSVLNVNGWNLHLGATAGYLEARSNLVGGAPSFPDAITGLTVGGGSFTTTTQVPFIGVYAAATYGGFAVDALLRTEYYQNNLNAPASNIFGQNIDAHGVTFSSSIAYQWKVPNSDWFIEPSAGVIISRTKVDPFNFLTAGTVGTPSALSAILQVNDIHSDIGRLGLRFGTTVDAGNVIWQPFAAVSVWHEFGPNVTASSATCPNCVVGGAPLAPLTISATSSTSTFGTFGQYSLGVSAQAAGTGWLGFARVDYRNGPDLQGWSGTGGIRYQFTPEGAPTRLPLKTKAPTPPLAQAINWTGFYIGGFGGANQGTADWNYAGGGVSPHIGGYTFGGDIGYDYQSGPWVLGVEGELEKINTNGGTACAQSSVRLVTITPPSGFPNPMFEMTCNTQANWLATATARVGYAWDRALFFLKGGGAWTHEEFSATCNNGPQNAIIFATGFATFCTNPAGAFSNGFTASTNRGGWVIGFGAEFALTHNWSAKAETDYVSFGDSNVTASDGSLLNVGMHFWEEKIGVNYRF